MRTLCEGVEIDLPRLLETRAIVQCGSGYGKSWALRRIIEQTAGDVQQIIIDPEGEFASLREKHDFIIAAPHDGDALAHPSTAKLLARRLLETGVSAVIDIFDLKVHERHEFVRLFLDSMVNAPKSLWHHVIVVLDEAHLFAPEKSKSVALQSVIDMGSLGRKRGFGLILATQRIAKLNKDVAAEMNNKIIGKFNLDIDVRRAAEELGMTPAVVREHFRRFESGQFFIYGPALTQEVTLVKVGSVATTHPKVGQRLMIPPPAPSAKIRKVLAELSDLPKEAEQEARTIEEQKQVITNLRRELTIVQKQLKQNGIPESEVKKLVNAAVADARKETVPIPSGVDSDAMKALGQIHSIVSKAFQRPARMKRQQVTPTHIKAPARTTAPGSDLRPGAVRILQELCARYPAGYSKPQVGALTRFKHTGGTFSTYISNLKSLGYIEVLDKMFYATEAGIKSLGNKIPDQPKTHDEVMALWKGALRAGAYRILEIIVSAGRDGIDKEEIACSAGMTASGGTFSTYISNLTTNGLVVKNNQIYIASDLLFPENNE